MDKRNSFYPVDWWYIPYCSQQQEISLSDYAIVWDWTDHQCVIGALKQLLGEEDNAWKMIILTKNRSFCPVIDFQKINHQIKCRQYQSSTTSAWNNQWEKIMVDCASWFITCTKDSILKKSNEAQFHILSTVDFTTAGWIGYLLIWNIRQCGNYGGWKWLYNYTCLWLCGNNWGEVFISAG